VHIDHINVRAPEGRLEELRNFYCTLLGLADGFRPAFGSRGYWLYADDRPLVHLSLGRAAAGPAPRGQPGCGPDKGPANGAARGLHHVAFRSSGVDALRARLEAQGVSYRLDYVAELDLSQVFFSYPVGTGIEVNFPGERVR
jgi:catechol 2,3-dioxygenase-like lactoylglutathione lyase family enzyme